MKERDKFFKAYIQDYARRVYGMHNAQVEEVCVAFISRHGFDPADAKVVTHFDDTTMTWTSHIERRRRGSNTQHRRGQGTMPRMPEGGQRSDG